MKYKLLIVDDEMPNLRLLERLFSSQYQCLTASSGSEAIRLLEQHDVAILITDQRMPEMTGIDLLKRSAQLRPHMVRILLTGYTDVEALVEAINCGLVYMYVAKPWNNDDLKLKISRAREHYDNNRNRNSLASANDRLAKELQETKFAIVAGLAEMLRNKNQVDYDHAVRVRGYATAISERMAFADDDIRDLAAAAILHGLSPRAHSLTSMRRTDELSPIDQSSNWGAALLSAIPSLRNVDDIIKFRRENFDGTGPAALSAEQIPLSSRVLRVADEYDSLVQPASSLACLLHEEAMQFLIQRSGKQFDPRVIAIMAQLHPEAVSRQPRPAALDPSPDEESNERAYVDAEIYQGQFV
jgi:response regulator RpfG family c-di-GMP phosphodiesterase